MTTNTTEQTFEKLNEGVQSLFDSKRYAEYLRTMSRFHSYSFSNSVLIFQQKPDATLVAGYSVWPKKFNRHVRKGEKGIRIFAPASRPKTDPNSVSEPRPTHYHCVSVFDISQTEGDPLPTLLSEKIYGDVQNYSIFLNALQTISPVRIVFRKLDGKMNGCYRPDEDDILIEKDLSEVQTIKTCLHELAHVLLHSADTDTDRNTKEVEAESVAYTVCSRFGIDTSEYSFGYIAGWSKDHSADCLQKSMKRICHTSDILISALAKELSPSLVEDRHE